MRITLNLGLGAVKKAVDADIDMGLYFKMICTRCAAVLLLRNFKNFNYGFGGRILPT
jgi:hypothetical protein